MAKDNKKNDNEETEAVVDEAVLAKKAKRKKLLLLIGLVILLVVVSVGSTLALVKLFSDPAPDVGVEGDVESQATSAAVVPPKKPAIYYPMQPVFVVNFLSEGRQRFLQAELNLLVRDKDVIPTLELHMPAIRNNLVMLFSGQLYEDLQTAEGKELLRQQALLSVQEVLEKEIGKPGVEQVLFTNFVMQ